VIRRRGSGWDGSPGGFIHGLAASVP
jgi:hypothetical protein